MPALDPVAEFIARNNAVLKKIEELLDEATDTGRPPPERDRALGTAGHLACRTLRRLQRADKELWVPFRRQQPTVFLDHDGLLRRVKTRGPYEAPRAAVTRELLELFCHPQPDDGAERINQTDRLLEQVVQDNGGDLEALITRTKDALAELATETCDLVGKKGQHERRIRLIRTMLSVTALANLGAAAAELQQHAWQAAPGLLHRAAELLQQAGHTLDSLPLLGLVTYVAIGDVAHRARLKEPGPTSGLDPTSPTPFSEDRGQLGEIADRHRATASSEQLPLIDELDQLAGRTPASDTLGAMGKRGAKPTNPGPPPPTPRPAAT
jgi:hypothetical protein